jgi:hypothetical protein
MAGATPMRQHRLQPPVTERERTPTPDPFADSPLDDEDDAEIGLDGPLLPQVKTQYSGSATAASFHSFDRVPNEVDRKSTERVRYRR